MTMRRCGPYTVMFFLGLVSQCPSLSAHAGLVSSEPGRRAVLTVPPKSIRLCFNENVEAKFSAVTVQNQAGEAIEVGAPQNDPKMPACLEAPLGALVNGSYTVKYRVLSVDGHVVDYGYGFKLNAP